MTEAKIWKPRSQPNETLAAALGGHLQEGACVIPGESGSLTLTPAHQDDENRWKGQKDSVHFTLRLGDRNRNPWAQALAEQLGHHRWWFEIQMSYLGPMGFHVIHQAHGSDQPGTDISNPVVQKMVSIVGGDSRHLTELFQEGPFVESLMAIVHQHPGSEVTATRVILRISGQTLSRFVSRIEGMVIVAQRLEQLGKQMRRDASKNS